MELKFIKSNEKSKIKDFLNETFGIEDLNFLLIETSKERIRAFSGNLSKEEINLLSTLTNIETIGSYLLKKEKDDSLRLSFDGCHILQDKIKKNIIKLEGGEAEYWKKGLDLEKENEKGLFVIESDNLFFGCAKSSGKVLLNHIPKDRRMKLN